MSYKSEDFVVGTTFVLVSDSARETMYEVITRDEALRRASGTRYDSISRHQNAIFYVKDNNIISDSYVVDQQWFDNYMTKRLTSVVFPTRQTQTAQQARKKSSQFIEDREKSVAFDKYKCPLCKTETNATVSCLTNSFICLACNQATKIEECKTLDCGHAGKIRQWYSPAIGMKSGCEDCYVRESPDEI